MPEPNEDLSPEEKEKADCVSLCRNLEIEMNEIVTCFCTGVVKKDKDGNNLPRPLVVVLQTTMGKDTKTVITGLTQICLKWIGSFREIHRTSRKTYNQ